MNEQSKIVLPAFLYIITGLIILYLGGEWYISAGGWDIYYIPVIITLVMLVIAIIIIKRTPRLQREFIPIIEKKETGLSLGLKISFYFLLVLVIRQLMIWKYYNPWEKLPIVFLVLAQVMVVEKIQLRDVGLQSWTKKNIGCAMGLGGLEFVFTTGGIIIVTMLVFGFDAFSEIYICGQCQLYWLSFPYQYLAVGFGEELLFRGYFYTKLRVFFIRNINGKQRDKMSFLYSMIITNVLFGLFHVPWYLGNWFAGNFSFDATGALMRVISTGLMGVYFTYLYEKSGSIAGPMLIHGIGNSIQPLFLFSNLGNPGTTLGTIIYDFRYIIIMLASLLVYFLLIKKIYKSQSSRKPWKNLLAVQSNC